MLLKILIHFNLYKTIEITRVITHSNLGIRLCKMSRIMINSEKKPLLVKSYKRKYLLLS